MPAAGSQHSIVHENVIGIGVELRAQHGGMIVTEVCVETMRVPGLADQLPQKLLLVHPILEGFATVDEHHWHFVTELPPQFVVAVHVNFLPGKSPAARQLAQAFLYHFAQMTSLAGIDHDLAEVRHAAILPLSLCR